ncbi:mevalonate kinase [Pokkaliibacter sp. MBI-7]|uniref:mevalonate kinase n=1 Tax=Proteobacteria bacterium 228 TaxID=2083153 RepID=A0A2S5KX65_9PROT|nr:MULTISPECIES: mevalonate kinase [Pokkaliibacter]MDH2434448.1 mevalonate kinase [Pokkaliibacter sp. MBI-7]PPC79298.1 mevalonate kinase [Pokkaliibacter plantistimulans]
MIQASAPAKVIVSGDHSAVYGAPALVAAVSPRARVRLAKVDSPVVRLHADGETTELTVAETLELQEELDELHDAFMEGEIRVDEIMESGRELFFYTMAQWLQPDARSGVELWLESDIPVSSGLGSSAATIAAACKAAGEFFGEPFEDNDALIALVKFIERLQHGRGSAMDASAVVTGGVIRLIDGKVMPSAPLDADWWVVFTGKAACSTGECVARVRERFATSPVWQDFAEVTRSMTAALAEQNEAYLQAAIRENHRLLVKIGVVPKLIDGFIAEIEALGGAAKVCGAGSIRGDNAGVVLVRGVNPTELAARHGFKCTTITGEHDGVRLE